MLRAFGSRVKDSDVGSNRIAVQFKKKTFALQELRVLDGARRRRGELRHSTAPSEARCDALRGRGLSYSFAKTVHTF